MAGVRAVAAELQGPVLLGFEETYERGPTSVTHWGVDVGAEPGDVVASVSSGHVTFAGSVPSGPGQSMLAVTIEDSGGRLWSYMPFEVCYVQGGDELEAGASLGAVSAEGDRSTSEPHIHIGLRVDEGYVDPMSILSETGSESGADPQPITLPTETPLGVSELPEEEVRPGPHAPDVPLETPDAERFTRDVAEPSMTEPGPVMQTPRSLPGDVRAVAVRDGGRQATVAPDQGAAKQALLTADFLAIGALVGLSLVVGAAASIVRILTDHTPAEVGSGPRPTGLQPR
jgi:murein DD-endopeptidase MepM/ murein hydrolase activator NlpD